ncbi:MAG TPA: class I SAM-dependent methyltransferase [Bacteroidales bacterium]|nr:class I SAM-dependent methyltransferase [Bacteroidales bacterium]
MNEFDIKALNWDQNPMIWNRANAIAEQIKKNVPLSKNMTALEFGAGTGVTSFILKDLLKEITLMDNSAEMFRIMKNKIKDSGVTNLKAVDFNLETEQYKNGTFDFLFNQMVLHHITDIPGIIKKFYNLLNPGGYIALADLYPEDGSFHGDGFTGHKGFDPEEISKLLSAQGFSDVSYRKCYTMNKQISDTVKKEFDIFLLTARKPAR